jgi:hypothetical protein
MRRKRRNTANVKVQETNASTSIPRGQLGAQDYIFIFKETIIN